MKRWKRLWKGTLPLFLVLWAVMVCILGKLNAESQDISVQPVSYTHLHAVFAAAVPVRRQQRDDRRPGLL